MKKNYDARQALEALLRDGREGISHAEIKAMIDLELNKGDEMDADLVAEAFQDASMKQPAFDMEANWSAIEEEMDQREHSAAPRRRYTRWALRAAAVLAVFAMITVGTVSTEAWRWDFLIKVFQPMMATLGIHVNVEDLGIVGEVDRSYTLQSSETTYLEESEAPHTVRGLAAKPTWLPDGYVFHSAQSFNGSNESSLMITYRKGASELFVQTVVYAQDDTLSAVNVLVKDDKEAEVSKAITITENNGVVSATVQDNLAFYMVWGRLSRADISSVITSIR